MSGDPLQPKDSQRTRLGTLILIRWLAIAGQSATILFVHFAIDSLDIVPVAATVGASVFFNGILTLRGEVFRRVDERAAAWHLAFDVAQLITLLGLTGGPHNPFRIFVLGPVVVAAATLPGRQTGLISVLAVAGTSAISHWHRPLPWPEDFVFPPLYTFGTWLSLCLGIIFTAFFTWRMAEESRRLDAAYEASRAALLKEQRVAAVGGLAASVAHELNTPLGTVCLLAHEIAAQMETDNPYSEDMRLLIGQAERCRDMLARLSRRGEREAMVDDETVPFSTLVEMAALPHADARITVAFRRTHAKAGQRPEPWVVRSPEILHGLGNIFQNAVQFARGRVDVEIGFSSDSVTVRINDDGPGYPSYLLERLGEPYLSTRDADGTHLGLGVFIATTLLSRTGARVTFANGDNGGAVTSIRWLMADLVGEGARV